MHTGKLSAQILNDVASETFSALRRFRPKSPTPIPQSFLSPLTAPTGAWSQVHPPPAGSSPPACPLKFLVPRGALLLSAGNPPVYQDQNRPPLPVLFSTLPHLCSSPTFQGSQTPAFFFPCTCSSSSLVSSFPNTPYLVSVLSHFSFVY